MYLYPFLAFFFHLAFMFKEMFIKEFAVFRSLFDNNKSESCTISSESGFIELSALAECGLVQTFS